MNTDAILSQLRSQRHAIDQAIAALEGSGKRGRGRPKRTQRRMSAAGRKAISEAAKKRWAAVKRQGRSSLAASA